MKPSRLLLAACVLLSALFISPAQAGQNPNGPICPQGVVQLGGGAQVPTYAAKFDTSSSGVPGTFHAAYDLVAGTLTMSQCCNLGVTLVQASDAYDIGGVAPGTAVTVTATLAVDSDIYTPTGCGDPNCAGYVDMLVRHGTDLAESQHTSVWTQNWMNFHDVLTLPVTIFAGAPEQIDFVLWGRRLPGGSHGCDASGTISFTGLPVGAFMISCQGYGGASTPAHRTSWGQLKTLYR